MRSITWTRGLAAAVALGVSAHAASAALVLNLNFGDFNAGVPTSDLYGGGSPRQVVEAAADYWTAAFRDSPQSVVQTLDITWGPTDALAYGGTAWSGHTLRGGIVNFDNDGTTPWFVDATPFEVEEYASYSVSRQNLGGGSDMIVGRRSFNATAFPSRQFDMLSVAIHEIGHTLGVLDGFPGWDDARFGDGNGDTLDVTAPRPFAGAHIPSINSHIPLNTNTMSPGIGAGERKLLTEADILAVAQTLGFTNINLDPQIAVPEPSSGLALLSLAGLLARRRRGA